MNWLKRLLLILTDERGEGEGTNGDGSAAASASADKGGATGAEDNPQGDGSTADPNAAPAPKYGEFGDDPDKVWQAFQSRNKEFETLKGKTTATERNLAALRKTLEGSGVQIVQEGDQIKLVPKEQKTERKSRFTDEHRNQFFGFFDGPEGGKKFLDLLALTVQDQFETLFEQQNQTLTQKQQAQKQFLAAKEEANQLMISYFPQLKSVGENGEKNEQFNQAFFDRATEIWEEKYRNKPEGELIAALQAARELNITTSAIQQAKREGFEKGKAEKKILGPVGGQASGKAHGGKLSREDYLKLTPEEREKYDLQKVKT